MPTCKIIERNNFVLVHFVFLTKKNFGRRIEEQNFELNVFILQKKHSAIIVICKLHIYNIKHLKFVYGEYKTNGKMITTMEISLICTVFCLWTCLAVDLIFEVSLVLAISFMLIETVLQVSV